MKDAWKPENQPYKYSAVGRDINKVQRVYAYGPTPDSAVRNAIDEAHAYLRHRPDTGPLTAWTFEPAA